jgi:hypothetical protein
MRSISVHGLSNCSKIPAGKSCEITVKAAENASASIYPEGQNFFIDYNIGGKNAEKPAEFTVNVYYNNDIAFKKRNLEFTDKVEFTENQNQYFPIQNTQISQQGTFNNYRYAGYAGKGYLPQKLTIINKNPSYSIKIKNISAQNKTGITIGDYSACSNLKSNSFCDVDITVGNEAKDDITPIYVTYTIDGKEDKDIVATAAIIISQDSNDKLDLGTAITSGLTRSSYLNALPKPKNWLASFVTSYLSIQNYKQIESSSIKPKSYDGSHLPNQLAEEGTKIGISTLYKGFSSIPKSMCKTAANVITKKITDWTFPSRSILPEEDGLLTGLVKHKKTTRLFIKTAIKQTCLAAINYSTGAFMLPALIEDIVTDPVNMAKLTEAIIDDITKQQSSDDSKYLKHNQITLPDSPCDDSDAGCVLSNILSH